MLKTGRVAMVLAGHFEINGLKSTEGFDLDSIGTVEFLLDRQVLSLPVFLHQDIIYQKIALIKMEL